MARGTRTALTIQINRDRFGPFGEETEHRLDALARHADATVAAVERIETDPAISERLTPIGRAEQIDTLRAAALAAPIVRAQAQVVASYEARRAELTRRLMAPPAAARASVVTLADVVEALDDRAESRERRRELRHELRGLDLNTRGATYLAAIASGDWDVVRVVTDPRAPMPLPDTEDFKKFEREACRARSDRADFVAELDRLEDASELGFHQEVLAAVQHDLSGQTALTSMHGVRAGGPIATLVRTSEEV